MNEQDFRRLGRPWCAVCGREVDRVEICDDFRAWVMSERVIRAICHGECTAVRISCIRLDVVNLVSLCGIAFRDSPLLAGRDPILPSWAAYSEVAPDHLLER